MQQGYAKHVSKECWKMPNKNAYVKAYHKTYAGLASRMLNSMRKNSHDRGHPAPMFDLADLRKWLDNTTYPQIYDNWVLHGYATNLRPSVDRLDSTAPYVFSNMRVVTWGTNNQAAYEERKVCKRVTKQCRRISMFTLEGTYVNTYGSISLASRETGVQRTNINACVTGRKEHAGGYLWQYTDL